MSIKLVFVARRRPELSEAEFQTYWQNNHAPLVKSLQETVRIRRYIQSYTLNTPANAGFSEARGMPAEPPPDGVAEVWWDSLEDLEAAFSGVDGLEAARLLIDDEGKFCDFATSRAFLTEERQII
jgi:uncharacterized protein (TIGR02118 family)